MNYDVKRSGERIRQLRIQNGYTQERLAEVLKIDQSFLSRVESGSKGCSVDLFVQFSDVFHVSLDFLILDQKPESTFQTENRTRLKAGIAGLIDQLGPAGRSERGPPAEQSRQLHLSEGVLYAKDRREP